MCECLELVIFGWLSVCYEVCVEVEGNILLAIVELDVIVCVMVIDLCEFSC